MNILYQVLIFLFTLGSLPVFFYEYFKKKKYRGKLRDKLGLSARFYNPTKPVIWVHAVSVGEVKAVSTLLRTFKEKFPDSEIVVSTVTTTGLNEAKKTLSFANYHTLLPVDFKPSIKRLLKGIKVELLLLVEGDIWPNFVQECKAEGARVGIINAKLSERSFKRLKGIKPFTKWYYRPIDFLLVQDEVYLERFKQLGLNPDNMSVIPNIKLDDVYPELKESERLSLIEQFHIKGPVITLGSTHEGEEELLLNKIKPLFDSHKDLKVLLVPRHPERNDSVEELVKKLNFTCARYSKKVGFKEAQVILIDVMGFLRTCYALSTLAVVAGSFTSKVGGHNILEPLWYKTPSIYGPYMYTQAQFVHLAKVAKAGIQTESEGLEKLLDNLLKNPHERAALGERGRAIFDKASGGTMATFNFIQKVLVDKGAIE